MCFSETSNLKEIDLLWTWEKISSILQLSVVYWGFHYVMNVFDPITLDYLRFISI